MIVRENSELWAAIRAVRASATAVMRESAGGNGHRTDASGRPDAEHFNGVRLTLDNGLVLVERTYGCGGGFVDLEGLLLEALRGGQPFKDRAPGHQEACRICGYGISTPIESVRFWFAGVDGAELIIPAADEQEVRERGDLWGEYPVHETCYERHRELLDLFAPSL